MPPLMEVQPCTAEGTSHVIDHIERSSFPKQLNADFSPLPKGTFRPHFSTFLGMLWVIYFQNGNILEVIKNFGRKFLELYFGGHIGFWDELRLTRF